MNFFIKLDGMTGQEQSSLAEIKGSVPLIDFSMPIRSTPVVQQASGEVISGGHTFTGGSITMAVNNHVTTLLSGAHKIKTYKTMEIAQAAISTKNFAGYSLRSHNVFGNVTFCSFLIIFNAFSLKKGNSKRRCMVFCKFTALQHRFDSIQQNKTYTTSFTIDGSRTK